LYYDIQGNHGHGCDRNLRLHQLHLSVILYRNLDLNLDDMINGWEEEEEEEEEITPWQEV
jgi:hypothetical protein